MGASIEADVAVVVIGAGAAGLAAARRLHAAGMIVRVLEARHRIGGRAWTASDAPFPLDLGCGWLHSAETNPWTTIAAEAGFTIDETRPLWGRQSLDIGFGRQEQKAFRRASLEFYARLEAIGTAGPDLPASAFLEPGGRWNALLDAVCTYMSGTELAHVSAQDANRYADSGVNWRIVEGYGSAIAQFGAGLPVTLGCPAGLVDWRGPRIEVETARGTLSADVVIVTVPTPILANGRLRFLPDLPEKRAAAASLPLGVADKVFLEIDRPDLVPVEGHVVGSTTRTGTGSYHLRPFGRPLIEGFICGSLARELEQAGPVAFFDFAVSELEGLFGSSIAAHLRPLVSTGWANEPFAEGSYSFALPGHAGARAILAAPVDDRLFFAGEACSADQFTTAHGAYATGITAADEVLALFPKKARRG